MRDVFPWGVLLHSSGSRRLTLLLQCSQEFLSDPFGDERFRQLARNKSDYRKSKHGTTSEQQGGFCSAARDCTANQHQGAGQRSEYSSVSSPHNFLRCRLTLCKRYSLTRTSAFTLVCYSASRPLEVEWNWLFSFLRVSDRFVGELIEFFGRTSPNQAARRTSTGGLSSLTTSKESAR